MDLLIKNAKIYGKTDLVDIACDGGKIVEISPGIKGEFKEVIDAEGNFVSSAFIDPHIHLDKVLVVDTVRPNISGTLKEAIEILWEKKRNYTIEDIVERAGKVIQWEVANGVTHIRTHVDVDTIGGLKPLEGLLATREKYKELVDLQIVAFPQEGIIQDPGTEELLYKAMEMGADVVGGMPHNEMTDDDSKRHIEILFEIAKKFDAPIDSHTDENDDPYSRTLEYLAAKTIKEGYEGRVTADHTCALSSYNDVHAAKVISLVKKADITMESNPVTNIVLEGRFDTYPKRRGLTRIKELLQEGVNVTFGQDCIKDTFYPFGKGDILEVANIFAHVAQLTLPQEIDAIYHMMTDGAAKMLGISGRYGLEKGKDADIVILMASSFYEALRVGADRITIRKGKIVARNTSKKVLKIDNKETVLSNF